MKMIQAIAILYWLLFLQNSDSYYVPYLLIGICSCIALYINKAKRQVFRRDWKQIVIIVSSLVFSLMICAANYALFIDLNLPEKTGKIFPVLYRVFSIVVVFSGGFLAFWNLLNFLVEHLNDFYWKKSLNKQGGGIYAVSIVFISAINLFFLFMCKYPGNITPDSLQSIGQSLSNRYSNKHPFYFTMIVKFFQVLGLKLTDNMNISVVLFSVFQVIFMAGCFSFVIVTLYQMQLSRKLIVGCLLLYVMMPYHIMYSFTMWKDVMFGGFVLLYITATFRILKNIGNYKKMDRIILLIGGIGTCLFRSNGWFVFLLTVFCAIVLFGRTRKQMCTLLAAILVITFILKHPVLSYLNVSQPDTIESLSVPAQQIARVVVDHNDLSEEQRALLGEIVNVEAIPEAYLPYISDPIKNLVRESRNQDYLTEHKAAYLKLYLSLGISHLDTYIYAWIDLTKGFWNGGYDYGIWSGSVRKNDFGVERIVHSEKTRVTLEEYLWLYPNIPVLQIFVCIGFFVWLTMGFGILCILRRDKEGFFLTIPVLAIVLSLMVATPVYAEFRYAYAVFCCVPFLLFSSFYKSD